MHVESLISALIPGISSCKCWLQLHAIRSCYGLLWRALFPNLQECSFQMEQSSGQVEIHPSGTPMLLGCSAHWRWPNTLLGLQSTRSKYLQNIQNPPYKKKKNKWFRSSFWRNFLLKNFHVLFHCYSRCLMYVRVTYSDFGLSQPPYLSSSSCGMSKWVNVTKGCIPVILKKKIVICRWWRLSSIGFLCDWCEERKCTPLKETVDESVIVVYSCHVYFCKSSLCLQLSVAVRIFQLRGLQHDWISNEISVKRGMWRKEKRDLLGRILAHEIEKR